MTSDRSTPDGEAAEPTPGDDNALFADDASLADDDFAGAVWSRSDELAARAETTLSAIAEGANPSSEAFTLANAYTDETSERLRAGIRRVLDRLFHRTPR